MSTNVERFDLVVVGGGLAGLAAGATARAAGATTVVLERHRPGGRARTTDRDGFLFNEGGHALYVGGPGMDVLRSLGVQVDGVPPPLRRYQALAAGRLHRLPGDPASLLRTPLLGARGRAQLVQFLASLPRLQPERFQGRSVREWLGGMDLRADAEALVRALLRLTTYVGELDEMGADVAVTQVQSGVRHGVLYLHGGWSQLVDALGRLVDVRTRTGVRAIEPAPGGVAVHTDAATYLAGAVVIAAGTPAAARTLLPDAPAWGLGEPVTAACLDVGTKRVPSPGYVLSLDSPVYGTTQGPPARQAPSGKAVMSVVRYGARSAEDDRDELQAHLRVLGVEPEDVVTSRFLPRMVVAGALPLATAGGLAGRPAVTASGVPGVYLAGDWVGPTGWLSEASLASGRAAAVAALSRPRAVRLQTFAGSGSRDDRG